MQARRYVEAPATQPLPFGLLSAAVVQPFEDAHAGLGVEYQTLACAEAHLTADQCISGAQSQASFTSDDGYQVVDADPFTVYAIHTCAPLGGHMEQADEAARQRLMLGAGRAIEAGFEASLADADDLTPVAGTPVHPVAGLAILEEYAAAHYGALPVLHITRGTGTLLTQMGAIDRYGRRLETKQGVPVASGGGYGAAVQVGGTGGVTNDATGRWMRITGTVVVRQGAIESHGGRLKRDPATNAPLNEYAVFAQQPVVVSYECINAAVLVSPPAADWLDDDGGAP